MKIVSFLPSSTEIVYALGLEDQLVGVTRECDYPDEVKTKPVVVQSAVDHRGLSPKQIDEVVSRALKTHQSLYVVNEELLRDLAPDLILTQDLCQVCAPSGDEIGRVMKFFPTPPKVIWLSPNCLADIFENLSEVGKATGREDRANQLVHQLQVRIQVVKDRLLPVAERPRVFCMEWFSPPYNAGHWMPELVEMAGGDDAIGQKGKDSKRIAWEQVLEYDPEVLILTPCGYDLNGTIAQVHLLARYPDWKQLTAVRENRIYAVDANSYFARPGPRVVDGIELLAALFHPKEFKWEGRPDAYRSISKEQIEERALDC